MRAIARGGIAVATAALLWLLLAVPARAATPTWAGTWQTSWTGGSHGTAEMILTQDGNTVSGTYDHLSGTVQGTVTADTLNANWKQNNSSGTMTFVLAADGKSWAGTWTDKISGGGNWTGTCSAGDCLAASAPTTASTTTSTSAKRPTAVSVQCDRDVHTTTNAHFDCHAFVNIVGAAQDSQKPSGTVTWTATKGQFLSGNSCALVAPDVGASSCSVGYDSTNEDAPIGTALPVTASYGGDSVFAASSGVHRLFPGPVSSSDDGSGSSIPGWVVPTAIAAAAAAAVAAGIAFVRGPVKPKPPGLATHIDPHITGPALLTAAGIPPALLTSAAATLTPAQAQAALHELDKIFAKALAPAPATPPVPTNPVPPGPATATDQVLRSLGIDPTQLKSALSHMSHDQIVQLQSQLKDVLTKAASAGH